MSFDCDFLHTSKLKSQDVHQNLFEPFRPLGSRQGNIKINISASKVDTEKSRRWFIDKSPLFQGLLLSGHLVSEKENKKSPKLLKSEFKTMNEKQR